VLAKKENLQQKVRIKTFTTYTTRQQHAMDSASHILWTNAAYHFKYLLDKLVFRKKHRCEKRIFNGISKTVPMYRQQLRSRT